MKTYTLTITETDTEAPTAMESREVARVDIPPVAEPLKLLVKLLQTVDDSGKPKRKYTKKKPSEKAPDTRNGFTAAGTPA